MLELRLWEVAEAGGDPRKRWLANKAYEMRLAPTLGEIAMQRILDATEYRWYPQYIIGRYIVDFYCPALNLLVEVDGSIHAGQQERDTKRQAWLQRRGYNGFRTTNKALMQNPDQVAVELHDWMMLLLDQTA
jgi:very-short-patch-repair endonuclease